MQITLQNHHKLIKDLPLSKAPKSLQNSVDLVPKLKPHYNTDKLVKESLDMYFKELNKWASQVDKPKKSSSKSSVLGVQDVLLSKINVNKKLFQNRDEDFSSESVERIIEAVENGEFKWAVFDPILLWRDPKGKLFVLSGHSRFRAFKELLRDGKKVDGKSFAKIPAKIIEVSQAEAVKIARESNNLSTKETDTERAKYYRNLRKDGKSKKTLLELAKKNEGKNANKILNLSYLDANGVVMQNLKLLENSSNAASQNNITVIADWVGEIRKRYPDLTKSHENEIANWLLKSGYGNKSGQFRDKSKFINRIHVLIQQQTDFGEFRADEPLNIAKVLDKNTGEQEFDAQLEELKEIKNKAEKVWKKKTEDFYGAVARGEISQEKADELIKKYSMEFAAARTKLNKFALQKQRYIKDGKEQATLFGIEATDHKAILKTSKKELDKIIRKAAIALKRWCEKGANKNLGQVIETPIEPKPTITQSAVSEDEIPDVITTSQLAEMEFDSLPISGKWQNIFQHFPQNAMTMTWGKGKNGKTSFCLQMADYLTQFGNVLYNFADQGISDTTKKLLNDMGVLSNPNIHLTKVRKFDKLISILKTGEYKFVFIDLVQDYEQASPKKLKELKEMFPEIGIHLVMESTKDGQFKGENGWEHLPDQLIDVVEYKAYSKGRLGNGEMIVWEEYWANKNTD